MSVPLSFQATIDYIKKTLIFLENFQWLFNYPNTHILADEVFSNFPPSWRDYVLSNLTHKDLQNLVKGEVDVRAPPTLYSFFKTVEALQPVYDMPTFKHDYIVSHNSGLSRKKLHEIESLAPLIDETCRTLECDLIIDVGSGLGYLSHMLHSRYNYKVLGLEASEDFVKAAYKNQEKHYEKSMGFVKFCKIYIDENSYQAINQLIEDHFSEAKNICITGLHACADLSIIILNLFLKIASAKGLIVMPCCYHRIQCREGNGGREYFKHFPSSLVFKEQFQNTDTSKFIRRPFLRLACQQSKWNFLNMTEMDLNRQARDCMFRAILQEIVVQEKYNLKRAKRKSEKSKTNLNNHEAFVNYVESVQNSHTLNQNGSSVNREVFMKKMQEGWLKHENDIVLFKTLIAFQARIQTICENFVLLDRVEFLREKGVTCNVRKVTDDFISPRCLALVSFKV